MSHKPSILALSDVRARLTDGLVQWDFAQLREAVGQWSGLLDQLDVQIVAFDLPNSLEWAALDIALLETQRVAVPLPSFFSDEQRTHALADSGAQLLVVAADAVSGQPEGWVAHRIRELVLLRLSPLQQHALPPDTALITYTSGSTGTPKGVCLSADTLIETANAIVLSLRDVGVERHLCVLPLTLLLENVAGLFANLINGSEIHLPNLTSIGIRGSSDVNITEFVEGVNWHAPHSVILVPALLLGVTAASEFGLGEFDHLKFIAVGGGKVASTLLERAATQRLPVYEGYGLTECGSVVAMNTPGAHRPGTVGRLLPHVRATVVDGELVVSHPCMSGGLGEQVQGCNRVLTGDRVEIDADGFLTVHGRIKNLYVTAFGRNVSPEWVESELQNELAVGYAAVFGEARDAATALLVARGEACDADLQAAVEACNARLPDYARIGTWHRLTLEQLTAAGGLTANGRIRRAPLESAFADLITPHANGVSLHA